MSDRIDHAAVARAGVHRGRSRRRHTADPAGTGALLAQAHATLALVEQQRIANLIALASDNLTLLGRLARAELHSEKGGIAAALGIEVKP